MAENKSEQELGKYMGLLERLKDSILKRNTKDENEDTEAEEGTRTEEELSPKGRGIVEISTDSLLFSIWSEWKQQEDEAEETHDLTEEAAESDEKPEMLEIVLEDAEGTKIPMSDQEIEKEKERATLQLLMKTKRYSQLTKPGEDGTVPDLDAYIIIHVAQKRMAAWAFVLPPSGNGKPLRKPQVYMALNEYSVCAGVDQEAIQYLVDHQPYFELIPIAYGKPMLPGTDGKVIEHYKRKVDKTFAIDEHGDVDYRVQNYIQPIHAGDIICEAVPPTQGTDGKDVLGSVIPAKNGNPAKLLTGQNTALNEEKDKIVATMDGRIQYESGKFQVKPLFYVAGDVDFNVGNIDFLGDVHITGDVREDFVVHATGSVTVEGLVEGALIEAGKDILISKGILGDEKAVIKAGGNVQTEYIENCIIYAGNTVRAGSIISSYVNSDNEIDVSVGRGTIIGGRMVAANKIKARNIGCRTERTTSLIAGELPYVQEQKEEIAESLEKLAQEKKELEKSLGYLTQNFEEYDPEKMQSAANLRLKKSVLSMKESHLNKQLEEFGDKTVDMLNCTIEADVIYPVTKIQIQDYAYTISEKTMSCRIHIGEDEIELL